MDETVTIGGQTVNYRRVGKGPNNIICIPRALGCTTSDFQAQMGAKGLDPTLFTMVVIDPPGYGKSRPPDRKIYEPNYHMKDAKMANLLMKKLGRVPYSVLGWDDGGNTALAMAYKHPKNVKKLVVWGCAPLVTSEQLRKLSKIRWLKSWSEDMTQPFLEVYGYKLMQETWIDYLDAKIKCFRENDGWSLGEVELSRIEQPVLICHGGDGMLIPEESAIYLETNLPNARLEILAGGQHDLAYVHREWFNKTVTDFILDDKAD